MLFPSIYYIVVNKPARWTPWGKCPSQENKEQNFSQASYNDQEMAQLEADVKGLTEAIEEVFSSYGWIVHSDNKVNFYTDII